MKTIFDSKLPTSKKIPMIVQFASFTSAGALGTIAHYLVLLGLVSIFVHPVTASVLGSLAGAIVNYLLSHHWVFRSNRRHSETLFKFFAIAGFGLVLNAAIMYVLVTIASVHYFLAQIAATGIVLFWNFLGNRFWTFADDA